MNGEKLEISSVKLRRGEPQWAMEPYAPPYEVSVGGKIIGFVRRDKSGWRGYRWAGEGHFTSEVSRHCDLRKMAVQWLLTGSFV